MVISFISRIKGETPCCRFAIGKPLAIGSLEESIKSGFKEENKTLILHMPRAVITSYSVPVSN